MSTVNSKLRDSGPSGCEGDYHKPCIIITTTSNFIQNGILIFYVPDCTRVHERVPKFSIFCGGHAPRPPQKVARKALLRRANARLLVFLFGPHFQKMLGPPLKLTTRPRCPPPKIRSPMHKRIGDFIVNQQEPIKPKIDLFKLLPLFLLEFPVV